MGLLAAAAGGIFTFVAAGSGRRKEEMVFLGYGIVVSDTGRVYLTNEGDTRVVEGPFGSVDEAKAAVEDAWLASEGEDSSCPVCDAFGCGGDGGGCYRFEGRGEVSDPRDFDDEAF